MILITGASGTIGTAILDQLTATGEPLRAMTRNPTSAAEKTHFGYGDFDDPASLRQAADGADAVFLLSPVGPSAARYDTAMVSAARESGVKRLVKLSSIGTGMAATAAFDWHSEGEEAVRTSGLAWTILRPSAFATNALRWADAVRAGKPIPNLTGDARQGVIDPRDIAAVAVEALRSSDHDGEVYALTGPELLSTKDQAARLGAALGRKIETVDVPLDVVRQQMLGAGMDEAAVAAMAAGIRGIRAGHNEILTTDLSRVLGRPATSFATWARDNRESFR